MFITNRALSRRTILRGMGAAVGAAVPRRHGARLRLGGRGNPGAPIRRRVRSARRAARLLGSDDDRHQLRAQRDHEAARGVPQPHDGGVAALRPARWSRDDRRGLVERRDPEAHAGREREQRRHGRSGHRRSDRAGHADAVARARHRRLHRVDRRLRPVVQLRLHEHHLVEERHHADADGDQPAQRVRAHVRASRHERSSVSRGWPPIAACSTRCSKSSRG